MDHKKPLIALALLCVAGLSQAGEKEELLKLRNTTTSLINQLVKQGILTDKMAAEMIKQAETDANQQVAEAKQATPKEAVPADEVRVAYVPDFVKDQIRQQVRSELKEEVIADVMTKAKAEKWGLPGVLPDWVNRFKLSGDIRLREQSTFMASDNTPIGGYYDWPTINGNNGGMFPIAPNSEVNTRGDRNQGRERLRLGIDANIVSGLDVGVRLATGNISNPISTNQSMGNMGGRYTFNIDRAYLRYNAVDDTKFNWLTLMGGRTPNPFFTGSSELVWDEDLSFEGAFGTIRHRLVDSGLSSAGESKGPTVYATAGIFPLQASTGLSTRDKWLVGGQTGLDWGFANQDSLKLGAAYFDYRNITAKVDPSISKGDGTLLTCNAVNAESLQSVPMFMQSGNTLVPVCGANGNSSYPGLMGLASNYEILNFNALYDLALFSPHHLKFSGDFAKNLGFKTNNMTTNYPNIYGNKFGGIHTAGILNNPLSNASTIGWQVKAELGWPKVDVGGHWNVFSLYKYVGSDAVLDAYTDSDFHQGGASNLGGTNVKGWVVGGSYGLIKNVWLTGKWLSGDVITGPKYGVDLMQLDLNAHF